MRYGREPEQVDARSQPTYEELKHQLVGQAVVITLRVPSLPMRN